MSFFHYDVLRTNRSAIYENVTPLTSLQEFEYKVYWVPPKKVCTLFSAIFHCPLCLMSTYLVPKSRSEHVHYWRGHQTSPTVVSLKGRLPQKLQSKSTLSCEIIHIRSLFRHGFINKPNY